MEEKKLTFQQAMNRLDSIVEQLSSPSLELEQAMDLFKEGQALSRQCEQQLKEFETQMNELITETPPQVR